MLIVDAELPDMHGAQVIEQLRAAEVPPQRTRVITLSGSTLHEPSCREAGADAFLLKPVPLAQLWETVEAS